jgi:2-desacetyl-2-hydroxyethyl bacteriochlorophyllide A dehydrogenase
MRAVMWEKPGELRVVSDAPDPTPGAGQLVVRPGACGVCGTDIHIAEGEFPPTPYPLIPGHEFAGTVVAVGPDTAGGWQDGERVAVDPSLFCGYCRYCRAGRGNLCAHWNAIGDTVDGAFAELVAVPAANAYRIPEQVDDQQGALIEPLSCAVHGLRRIGNVVGADVLIMGAGTMGLLLGQLIQGAGASSLTVVDRVPARLEAAKALGADDVATAVAGSAREHFDVCVDATGVPAAIEAAFSAVARGGTLLIFGVTNGDASVSLPPFRIYNDEINVVGSMAVLNSFGAAVDLMAAGRIETAPLLGSPLPLERFGDALDMVRRGEGIKVQVAPTG